LSNDDKEPGKKGRQKPARTTIAVIFVILMDVVVFLLFFINQIGSFDLYSSTTPLFWQINVVMDYVTLIPLGITFFMAARQYAKWRYRHALYLMFSWLFLIASGFSRIIEKSLTHAIRLTFAWYVPITFTMLLLIDSISRESIDPVKIVIATSFSILYLTNLNMLFIVLLIIFLISVAVYYVLVIYMNAPTSLKKQSGLAFIGAMVFGYGNMFLANSRLEMLFPGCTALASVIGYSIYAISFAREPRLAYILPFRVISLTVFETSGGIPLFSHTWKKSGELVDESLFSGMLQGIGLVLDEAIEAGDIESIKMNRAVMLLKRSPTHSVAFVLVATRFSRTLRLALNSFADKFFKTYAQYISKAIKASQFESASALVDECFAFIPKYD
jgi:hypothetical protein